MKITIERKWKKKDYTIGNLFIDNKQVFCNTLEPTDRGLTKRGTYFFDTEAMSTQDISWVYMMKKAHSGTTAIPCGVYKVLLNHSDKFGEDRPRLMNVPGFSGILIHEGNKAQDTQGCILVGKNTSVGWLSKSKDTLKTLIDRIRQAQARNEPVLLTIR